MAQPAADISPSAREAIAEALNQAVAETAVTTMLAQNFHWNVTGMAFGPLHELFQTVYEDHFVGQDDLAERIKALDCHAEGRLAVMVARSKVAEHDGTQTDVEMLRIMEAAQVQLSTTLSGVEHIAAEHGDTLTEDLAVERGRIHEKFAWMMRAHLK